jgi:hypothetical protein
MDLGTVRKKLADGQYQTVQQFMDDIHLVCDQAILFNGERSMFGFIATDVKSGSTTSTKRSRFHRKTSGSESLRAS